MRQRPPETASISHCSYKTGHHQIPGTVVFQLQQLNSFFHLWSSGRDSNFQFSRPNFKGCEIKCPHQKWVGCRVFRNRLVTVRHVVSIYFLGEEMNYLLLFVFFTNLILKILCCRILNSKI